MPYNDIRDGSPWTVLLMTMTTLSYQQSQDDGGRSVPIPLPMHPYSEIIRRLHRECVLEDHHSHYSVYHLLPSDRERMTRQTYYY